MSDRACFPASPYTGLFARHGAMQPLAHDPLVALWAGEMAPSAGRAHPLPVGGAGWSAQAAEQAGIGEAIERLQPYRLPRDQIKTAAFVSFPGNEPALDPARLILFHAQQYQQPGFPFSPFTSATPCDWVCMRDAASGAPCWVPADVVYLFARGAHQFCPGLSTGFSCGRPGDPVLLRGLQEIIERDALVGAWWGRYALTECPPAELWAALDAELVRRVQRPNLDYHFYKIDSPFHPQVTLCTVAGENRGGFCFALGSACRTGERASYTKSLLEAIQSLVYARSLKEEVRLGQRQPPLVPKDFADHAVYYSLHPEKLRNTPLQRAPRRTASPAVAPFPDPIAAAKIEPKAEPKAENPAAELQRITQRLGPERPVLFRAMTPPGIAQERSELYVLRVLVPGLQPLHGDDRFPQLGGPLWAPRRLADFAALPPHPFP